MHFKDWLSREMSGLLNLLLPPACALCLEPLAPSGPDHFCHSCNTRIPPVQHPCCPRCALPYPADTGHGHLCQACLTEKTPLFDSVTAVGAYDGTLRDAVQRFKYRSAIDLDRPLAALLAERLSASGLAFDCIIPVPLHHARLIDRGYNQSALIGRRLSRHFGVPSRNGLLVREHPALPQQGLSARERLHNVRATFSLRACLDGDTVLLVDDVMTTGATVRECARVLLKGGAGAVHVAVLARAGLH